MMFNYFFGSDTRSLGFLEIVNKKVPTIKVITLPHSPTGRGRKLKPNPVEVFVSVLEKYFQNLSLKKIIKSSTST